MKRTCGWCGVGIVSTRSDARYCSTQHRVYAHREARKNPLPQEMTSRRRWIRHTASKVPLTTAGTAASSTDPRTWTTYAEAQQSREGVGIGFVLGDGIGCLDLDHCLIDGQPSLAAQGFLIRYPNNYIEISPSGEGLHIWGLLKEAAGTKRNIGGLSVETYSRDRYITVTHNVYQRGQLEPL